VQGSWHIPFSRGESVRPKRSVLVILQAEQAQMLAALRRAPYGYGLALHILLCCAAGHNPTTSAALFFCSRSRLYGSVQAYWEGTLSLEHAVAHNRLCLETHWRPK
jgi:hypothetical protein